MNGRNDVATVNGNLMPAAELGLDELSQVVGGATGRRVHKPIEITTPVGTA